MKLFSGNNGCARDKTKERLQKKRQWHSKQKVDSDTKEAPKEHNSFICKWSTHNQSQP